MSRPIPALIAVGAAAIVVIVGVSLLASRAQPPNMGASLSAIPTPTGPPLGLALVNLDGTVRQDLGLTRDAWMADLSRDGRKVVFLTSTPQLGGCGGCSAGKYPSIVEVGMRLGELVLPDATGLDVGSISNPAWSPDGNRLAFSAIGSGGNVDIWVADLGVDEFGNITAATRRLTTDPAIDAFPAWTPDGTTILYDNAGATALDDSGFSPTQEIWSVAASGGEPVRLTSNDEPDSQPDVSNDGIVAYSHADGIWRMTERGADQRPVTGGTGLISPRWSPDGTRIATLRYDPSERAQLDPSLGLPLHLPLLKVVVLDVATGVSGEPGPRVASDLNAVSWTPDGEALLINRYDEPS